MIKELENLTRFFQDDEVSKYFFNRKLTINEKLKLFEVKKLIDGFNNKVFDGENNFHFHISYLDDYGFYSLLDEDRGHFGIEYYGEDIETVFISYIYQCLIDLSIDYEFENREENKKVFSTRFDSEYDSCLIFDEYALDKWFKYYDGNILDYIIETYENHINNIWYNIENNITYEYDRENNCFRRKELNMRCKK